MTTWRHWALERREAIEEFVNTQEAVDCFSDEAVPFWDAWPKFKELLELRLGVELITDLEDRLYLDLKDWWKQGNFRVWAEGETHPQWGFGRWSMADVLWWIGE